MNSEHRPLHFVMLLGLAWAVAAALLLAVRWSELGDRLFDADDAMRLVQLREFLAGRGWFDLHEPRLDPPAGYEGHWSRLIDLGLAGLFMLARLFVDAGPAEIFMRAAWPLIWLLVAIGSVAAISWRIAGRNAAVLALVIAALALPAFQHFKPGAVDHHNVQIALALATVAAAAWADRARGAAVAAGLLTGLALAVGLEGVFFAALAGAVIVIRFIADGRAGGEPLKNYGFALAASLGVAFLLSVKPETWSVAACDALAINWAAPGIVAGLGLAIAGRVLAANDARARLVTALAVSAVALALFAMIEPRCLRGPFALADDAIRSIWLDGVDETEPLMQFVSGYPMMAIWLCTFPVVAMLAGAMLAGDRAMRADSGFLLVAAAFVLSLAATLAAVKVYSYAMWFGMPLVAAAASRISFASGMRGAAARLTAAIVFAPAVVTTIGWTVAHAVAASEAVRPGIAERLACTHSPAFDVLAGLPAGLVATDVQYGSYVLALTPHRVLAAPYHRLRDGIVDAHALFHGPAEGARAIAAVRKLDYVAICGVRAPTGVVPPRGSLWAELNNGRVPQWLERLPGDAPFTVYRVRR